MRLPTIVTRLPKQAMRRAGYTIAYDADYDQHALEVMTAAEPYTMTTRPRLFALWQSIRHVTESGVPGAIVECGVWRGGSMYAAARTLLQTGSTDRQLYLFDTFSGMTEPTDADVSPLGSANAMLGSKSRRIRDVTKAEASLGDVRDLMTSSGYPSDKIHYVVGDVAETLPDEAPDEIAVLRLDTDWYESTLHELETLMPRLAVGGVLIIDDYGYWAGARKAVDEYFGRNHPVLLARIDAGCRMAVVTAK